MAGTGNVKIQYLVCGDCVGCVCGARTGTRKCGQEEIGIIATRHRVDIWRRLEPNAVENHVAGVDAEGTSIGWAG